MRPKFFKNKNSCAFIPAYADPSMPHLENVVKAMPVPALEYGLPERVVDANAG
jgi:hypothetical protein